MTFQTSRQTAARSMDAWNWLAVPTLTCLMLTLLLALPIRVFGLVPPEPVFLMVPAFVWAVIRPSILPPIVLMISGLLIDILWGAPLGLWGFSLLFGYAGVLASRSFASGQGQSMNWVWYAITCLIVELTAYLVTLIDVQAAPSIVGAFWQWAVTAALYPVAHQLIERFEGADVRFK
jgi:rod shape-determining protein MreD